jgi:hypothetical protein
MTCRPQYSINAKWPDIVNVWQIIHNGSVAVIGVRDTGERYCHHVISGFPQHWMENPVYGFRIKKLRP